jgi:DNA-binding CsgD family transcriptional regulator
MEASDNWTPPTDCIFKGTADQFFHEVSQRLRELDSSSEKISNARSLAVYPTGVDPDAWIASAFNWISNVHAAKPLPLYVVGTSEIFGGYCRLKFTLPHGGEDWTAAKVQIDQLLTSLVADGWIDTKALEQGEQPQPERGARPSTSVQGSDLPLSQQRLQRNDSDLTPRLEDVAHLIADGYSNAEIAKKLGVSISSIQDYAKKIAERWDMTTSARVELKKAAQERGFGSRGKTNA